MAVKTKFRFDAEKFANIRNRIADVYLCDGARIRGKKTVRTNAIVLGEGIWLVDEIERLADGPIHDEQKERYAKTKKFFGRVKVDLAEAIAGGLIVKTSAEVFGALRFLAKCLEDIVRMEDEDLLTETITMPPEETNRIELNLEEGIEDSDAETEAQLLAVGATGEDDDEDLPATE